MITMLRAARTIAGAVLARPDVRTILATVMIARGIATLSQIAADYRDEIGTARGELADARGQIAAARSMMRATQEFASTMTEAKQRARSEFAERLRAAQDSRGDEVCALDDCALANAAGDPGDDDDEPQRPETDKAPDLADFVDAPRPGPVFVG